MKTEGLHVVRPRAAGLDVHKMAITATVRICRGEGEPVMETRCFSTLPSALKQMVAWLSEHGIEAAVMEGTGVYWLAPFEALEGAGIEPILVHAHQVKQLKGRKTDVTDSVWLACICQFGLCPGNNESGGKRRKAGCRPGSRSLRAALVECAHGAARTKGCQFEAQHRSLAARRGYKRAIVAVAHKMVRIIHAVLRTGKPYDDCTADYEELLVKRNAARWIRMLLRYGYITPSDAQRLRAA